MRFDGGSEHEQRDNHRPEPNVAFYLAAPSRPPARERRIPRTVGDESLGADRSDVAFRAHHPPAQPVVLARPHEVPLLGGEFAWIAMRTPEWAEATNEPDVELVPAHDQEVKT